MRTVYLDNNATTQVRPEVVEVMTPFFTDFYGNPSSVHRLGAKPASAVLKARRSVAGLLGCTDSEIIFTSCGTESDNIAIGGALGATTGKKHVITTAVEHPAVTKVFNRLESLGYRATYLPVDGDGCLDPADLEGALTEDTALVSVMYANNETGVLMPIQEITRTMAGRNIPLHVDAVTAAGKIPLDMAAMPIDLLAVSGHKLHAPKGVGVLFCRKGTPFEPMMDGSTQERGRRPGTENVPGIVAMGKACEIAAGKQDYYDTEVRRLRDRLEDGLVGAIEDTHVNGRGAQRLPTTSNVLFRGIDAGAMLLLLDEAGICASAGSACSSRAGKVSPTLLAMGLTPEDAAASIRFSLSAWTTEEDIDYCIDIIPGIVDKLRGRKTR